MIQGQFPLWLLTLLLGLFASAIVFCCTTNDCPPKYHSVSTPTGIKRYKMDGWMLRLLRLRDAANVGVHSAPSVVPQSD